MVPFTKISQKEEAIEFPEIKELNVLGRVFTVHRNTDFYYLTIIFHQVRTLISLKYLRIVNNIIYDFDIYY